MNTLFTWLDTRTNRQWLFFIAAVKLVYFFFFLHGAKQQFDASFIVNNWAIQGGDTNGYYEPVESAMRGEGYGSLCRMPGLLPIYGPLYLIFGKTWGMTLVVVFQWIAHLFSILLLGKLAQRWMNTRRAFVWTVLLYSLSTFVSSWDLFLYSDSFSTSFMVFSVYCFFQYKQHKRWGTLMWSGFWLTWAVFFRQIYLLFFAIYAFGLIVHYKKNVIRWVRAGALLGAPLVFCISGWTAYNYMHTQRIIPLIAPFEECYGYMPPQLTAMRDFVITIGGDCQPWIAGTESNWLTRPDSNPAQCPISESQMCSAYNRDSLFLLRENYRSFYDAELGTYRDSLGQIVLEKVNRYSLAYRTEHPMRYYVSNRLRMLRLFVSPMRLDNLPGPALKDMTIIQKLAKGGSLLLLMAGMVLGTLGSLLWLWKAERGKKYYVLLPWSILIFLGAVLGFIEQRYLVAAYPFMLVFTVYLVEQIRALKVRASAH